LQVNADDMALQFFETFHGVKAIACPMAEVGTGADVMVTANRGKHGIGMPVGIGPGVIVDSHFDTIDAGEAVDAIPLGLDGLSGKITKSKLLAELEIFLPFFQSSGDDDAHRD